MQQYLAAGAVPVGDPAAMWQWFAGLSQRSQAKLGTDFRRRIYEEHAKLNGGNVGVEATDPDVAEFDRTYRTTAAADRDNLAGIKREQAFYLFRMQRARARRDLAAEAEASKQFRNFSDLIHDCELRAQRLGRDLGESFSATDVDRMGRALAYWLMNSADGLIDQVTAALMKALAAGPLDREVVRRAIDPLVIEARVVAPLVRAAQVNAPIALPERFVEAVKAGVVSTIEDGAAEFDRLYAAPARQIST